MKKRLCRWALCLAALLALLSGSLQRASAACAPQRLTAERRQAEEAQQTLSLEDYLLEDDWRAFFEAQPFSLEQLRGKSLPQLLGALWQQLTAQLRRPLQSALRVTALLALLGFFRLLGRENASPELEYTLQSVMTVVVFLLLSTPVLALLEDFRQTLESGRVFLAQLTPVLCSVLAASGQTGTALVCSTVFSGVLLAVAQALYGWVAPLIRIFLALSVTSGLCGSLRLEGFVQLLRRILYWSLGVIATLFAGYLGLQSVLANAGDSLALKTGKLVLSGGIPIVGGAVSDAVGTVYTGLRLVKSAVGVLGIVGLLVLFLPGLLQCLVYGLVCRACSAAARLFDNAPAAALLDGLAEAVRMLGAVLTLYLMLTVLSTALLALWSTGAL